MVTSKPVWPKWLQIIKYAQYAIEITVQTYTKHKSYCIPSASVDTYISDTRVLMLNKKVIKKKRNFSCSIFLIILIFVTCSLTDENLE